MIIDYLDKVTEIAHNCPEFTPTSECACTACGTSGEINETLCLSCANWHGGNCHIYLNYIDRDLLS